MSGGRGGNSEWNGVRLLHPEEVSQKFREPIKSWIQTGSRLSSIRSFRNFKRNRDFALGIFLISLEYSPSPVSREYRIPSPPLHSFNVSTSNLNANIFLFLLYTIFSTIKTSSYVSAAFNYRHPATLSDKILLTREEKREKEREEKSLINFDTR